MQNNENTPAVAVTTLENILAHEFRSLFIKQAPLCGDFGGIKIEDSTARLFSWSGKDQMYLEEIKYALLGLGITDYEVRTTKHSSWGECDVVDVDVQTLIDAFKENKKLSSVIEDQLIKLLKFRTNYFDEFTAGDLAYHKETYKTNPIQVIYRPEETIIRIRSAKPIQFDEVDALKDFLKDAIKNEKAAATLENKSIAPLAAGFTIDTDLLLQALKINFDRVDYSNQEMGRG